MRGVDFVEHIHKIHTQQFPGLAQSGNVLHRNSFSLIFLPGSPHPGAEVQSEKGKVVQEQMCVQPWSYSGMAFLEKSLKSKFAFAQFSRKGAIAPAWLPSARGS